MENREAANDGGPREPRVREREMHAREHQQDGCQERAVALSQSGAKAAAPQPSAPDQDEAAQV
jgi:hypothetical protein